MDKQSILSKLKKTEHKLLVSKFLDKIEYVEKNNKIISTDFYNELEQSILKKVIDKIALKNCIFYGGFYSSERKLIIIYPEKMAELFVSNNFKFDTIISVFEIIVPKENKDFFNHRAYLGGLLKLGIKREKIGDIQVFENKANIIVKKEIEQFLYSNLKALTRFNNCEINNIKTEEIIDVPKQFKELKIISASLRLDNIVAELLKSSRSKASEILANESVFVNYENETKSTKIVKEQDIITIRSKGKYIIKKIEGNTRKGKYIIVVSQYC